MPVSFDDFLRSLSDTGLLPPDEVSSIMDHLPADKTAVNVEQFAKDLVKQKKLTRFQAAAIYQGQSKGLCFGDYVVLDKIGSGGMGQVFKAEHRRLKRQVAIKLLRASSGKSEKAVKRFQREAETAAKLKHPNIVGVHDAGELNGMHFIVMEYVEGRDLQSVIKEKGSFTSDLAANYILQAARGLHHAHENGVVHRDIKPSNLLLDKDGRVTILDMGLARLDQPSDSGEGGAEGEDDGRLTMPGQMMGTVNYVSPEQAVDAHEVDARSDVYSLGCTFYYLLRGKPPYSRENMALTLLAHCEAPIPNLCEEIPGFSEPLNAVFRRMMAKKAADRFANMTELIEAMESCLAVKGTTTTAQLATPAAGKKSSPAIPVGAHVSPSKLPTFQLAEQPAAPVPPATPVVATPQPMPAAVAQFAAPTPVEPPKTALPNASQIFASEPVPTRIGRPPKPATTYYLIGGGVVLLLALTFGIWSLFSGGDKKKSKSGKKPAATAPAEDEEAAETE